MTIDTTTERPIQHRVTCPACEGTGQEYLWSAYWDSAGPHDCRACGTNRVIFVSTKEMTPDQRTEALEEAGWERLMALKEVHDAEARIADLTGVGDGE